MNMITYRIYRVVLTGVVGVIVAAVLAGCSDYGWAGSVESRLLKCASPDGHPDYPGDDICDAEADAATLAAEEKQVNAIATAQIQELGKQAAETAVEAYTEEPRWEGATDYSQACSSSSGDLGC
jgi:hypothetical protein